VLVFTGIFAPVLRRLLQCDHAKLELWLKVNDKMKIGDISKRTGLSASAIRFYEKKGVLTTTERGANGYRTYSAMDEQRLHLICIAQNLGFSLADIKAFLRAAPGMVDSSLLALIDDHVKQLDDMSEILRKQRRDIVKMRQTLTSSWETGACITSESLYADMSTPNMRSARRAR
jgi:DNA-binding transcriptional MerR regulator